MGINPSGRGNNNDLWISGAHDQHPDVQDAGGPSGAVGPHRVSTQNNTSETPSFLSRISAAVSSFFSNIFGRSSSSRTSSRASSPQQTPSSSRRSSNASDMEVGGAGSDTGSIKSTGSTGSSDSARSIEGAARGLQKKGYTPGVKVDSPTVPRRGGVQRPNTPPPPPPSSPSTSGIRPVRAAPPPPTTAGTSPSPSTSGTGSTKRKAPQPPEAPNKRQRTRRDSISSISSADSTVSTDSSVAESRSIADRLKAELEIHNTTKQAQLDSLSTQVKNRWIEREIDEPMAYGLSCMQTLTARLGQARLEAQKELRVLRPGINEAPLKAAISQSRSIWDLGEKEQKQDGESVLLQVLIRMGLEGSLLSPEVDYVDYVDQLVEEYGDTSEGYNWQPTLQSLAQDLNGIRNSNPNGMKKFWSSFAGKGEVTVRSLTNKFMAANTGKYDPSSVKVDVRWNRGALDLMKSLSPEVYVKTVSIMAIDAFTLRE
ncbi:hypothetical protein SBV42_02355 [Chlamydia crocodili]|uniref:Uncharacterized protein n=1 Tax=Chlamydia crocodili TaxID=2766982 RepID=A0ABX8CC95_9CHLA|nr:hypothetical protein [Chlamydia crocodili]QVE48621.1 hypothetical protein H9Q19_02735 [Chlamydia crocodili]